jgi:hypothetical protein
MLGFFYLHEYIWAYAIESMVLLIVQISQSQKCEDSLQTSATPSLAFSLSHKKYLLVVIDIVSYLIFLHNWWLHVLDVYCPEPITTNLAA